MLTTRYCIHALGIGSAGRTRTDVYFADTGNELHIYQPGYIELANWGYLGVHGPRSRVVIDVVGLVVCFALVELTESSVVLNADWSPPIPCAAPDAWTLDAEFWLRPGLADSLPLTAQLQG